MAQVFSGVRGNVAAALAAAVGGVALTACNTGGSYYDNRPAPRATTPQHSCGAMPTTTPQPAPTYTQPTTQYPAPAPAPRPPQKSCGARCG